MTKTIKQGFNRKQENMQTNTFRFENIRIKLPQLNAVL